MEFLIPFFLNQAFDFDVNQTLYKRHKKGNSRKSLILLTLKTCDLSQLETTRLVSARDNSERE